MGELLRRVVAYLIARFGEAVLEWTLRKALAELGAGPELVQAAAPVEEPYFWDECDPCEEEL